jgi:hypothetical protein
MKRKDSVIAARIYFLERALDRMEQAADNAETELRADPTNSQHVDQVRAFYALADETWGRIQALRAGLSGASSGIYFDRRLAELRARAARQALL